MAENQEERDTDDLSEEPSQHKLQDLREKGRVAQSRELAGLCGLLATGAALYILTPTMSAQFNDYMREMLNVEFSRQLDLNKIETVVSVLGRMMKVIASIGMPIAIIGFLMGALGSYAQIGSVFSTEPLNPDFNRINPINGLKQYFTMKKVFDSLRLILKATVVVLISYALVKTRVLQSPHLLMSDPQGLIEAFSSAALVIFLSLVAILMIFAAFDFWLQRWEYHKQARLTKKEAKDEHKEHEGDPLIKARIRSIQREAARRRMMESVKTADVVVTNPTHYAVALKYEKDSMAAPRVVAKGADFMAQKIRKQARDFYVPLIENKPLARTLYRTVKVGQVIPRPLFQAVAEVLAFVYQLKSGNRNVRAPEGTRRL